jgi:hypothetical protein
VTATPTLLIGTDDTDLKQIADGVIPPDKLSKALNTALLKVV